MSHPAPEYADPAGITGYHAHVYYDGVTKPQAAALRAAIEAGFTVTMGRWHDEPVGPHPISMYQVAFGVEEFPKFVPWLMVNHGRLHVLIHPNTGDAVSDHALYALWLGDKLPLNIEFLKKIAKQG